MGARMELEMLIAKQRDDGHGELADELERIKVGLSFSPFEELPNDVYVAFAAYYAARPLAQIYRGLPRRPN